MPEEKNESAIDDLFENLDKDDTIPTEEDGNDGTSEGGDDKQEESTNELKEQLEAMQKERQGLLNAAKAERHKRQEMKSSLDSLTTTVNNILQQRQAVKNGDTDNIGIPVEFSEDGDQAFVKQDKIAELLNPLHQKIGQLENALQISNSVNEGHRKAQEVINTIVNSDDRFGDVYNKYQGAREWLNEQVVEFQRDNNLDGVMTSGQALDKVVSDDLEAEFNKKFPGFNIIDVATAEDSQRHFNNMLANTANVFESLNGKSNNNSETNKDSSKFKKIINKPAGLGSATNGKGNELSITEKVGKLDATEIMGLSDAQAKQLEQAILQEERSEGIKF